MSKFFRIPWASVAGENGAVTDVLLPGAPLRPGAEHYDAKKHKGRLLCGGCRVARVHFKAGAERIIGGDLEGPRDHLATNPGQDHVKCHFPKPKPESEPRVYDSSKGYRIHLNIEPVSDHFNARMLAHRDSDGRIVHHYPDIADMEPYAVQSVKDIIKLIEKGNYARLRQSVILHHGYEPIAWDDFFVRYDTRARGREPMASLRFKKLTETLIDKNYRAAFPVLMEMRFHKGIDPVEGYKTARGLSRSMFWKDEGGKSHHIQPRLTLTRPDNKDLMDGVAGDGTYLVLGHARLETKKTAGHVDHVLDMRVRYAHHVLRKDILTEIVKTPELPGMAPA